jgi:diaminohydroxyphosphoribosylaminopyrimidine deaminase/5-amino-6-(5-phosphoribosylamino)uracil reductase
LKWAQSPDGFLAPEKIVRSGIPQPFWISNKRSKQLVHQWRSQEDAILVGSNTVLYDNPRLNTRYWKGKSPLRVILDKNLAIEGDYHVLDNSERTLIITGADDHERHLEGLAYEFLDFEKPIAEQLCRLLMKYEISSLIVEGGEQTLITFIDEGLWDEARIFSGATALGKGLKAPQISGKQVHFRHIGDNTLTILRHD